MPSAEEDGSRHTGTSREPSLSDRSTGDVAERDKHRSDEDKGTTIQQQREPHLRSDQSDNVDLLSAGVDTGSSTAAGAKSKDKLQAGAPDSERSSARYEDSAETATGEENHSDYSSDKNFTPTATTIPVRFTPCPRCAKCKYQSKGSFYCRARALHLFAPGWDAADQTKRWDIPRGFLRWLRHEGPVEGCKTDEKVMELALEHPLQMDSFPWYSSAGWKGAEMYRLPMFKEKKSSAARANTKWTVVNSTTNNNNDKNSNKNSKNKNAKQSKKQARRSRPPSSPSSVCSSTSSRTSSPERALGGTISQQNEARRKKGEHINPARNVTTTSFSRGGYGSDSAGGVRSLASRATPPSAKGGETRRKDGTSQSLSHGRAGYRDEGGNSLAGAGDERRSGKPLAVSTSVSTSLLLSKQKGMKRSKKRDREKQKQKQKQKQVPGSRQGTAGPGFDDDDASIEGEGTCRESGGSASVRSSTPRHVPLPMAVERDLGAARWTGAAKSEKTIRGDPSFAGDSDSEGASSTAEDRGQRPWSGEESRQSFDQRPKSTSKRSSSGEVYDERHSAHGRGEDAESSEGDLSGNDDRDDGGSSDGSGGGWSSSGSSRRSSSSSNSSLSPRGGRGTSSSRAQGSFALDSVPTERQASRGKELYRKRGTGWGSKGGQEKEVSAGIDGATDGAREGGRSASDIWWAGSEGRASSARDGRTGGKHQLVERRTFGGDEASARGYGGQPLGKSKAQAHPGHGRGVEHRSRKDRGRTDENGRADTTEVEQAYQDGTRGARRPDLDGSDDDESRGGGASRSTAAVKILQQSMLQQDLRAKKMRKKKQRQQQREDGRLGGENLYAQEDIKQKARQARRAKEARKQARAVAAREMRKRAQENIEEEEGDEERDAEGEEAGDQKEREDEQKPRTKEQAMGKRQGLADRKAEVMKLRQEATEQKAKALARRGQLEAWSGNRPALAKIPPGEGPTDRETTSPPAAQDLYRNALQKMLDLDDLPRSPAKYPATETAVGTASGASGPTSVVIDPTAMHTAQHTASQARDAQGTKSTTEAHAIPVSSSFLSPSVASTMGAAQISPGTITPTLIGWREDTALSLEAQWPASTVLGRAGGDLENPSGDFGGESEDLSPEVSEHEQSPALPQPRKKTSAAGGSRSGRQPVTRGASAVAGDRSQDLKGFYNTHCEAVVEHLTQAAMEARLHFWGRDIPVLVEQGGLMETAVSDIPVNMSLIKATPSPGEWNAWAGRSLDKWRGLVPLSVDEYPEHPPQEDYSVNGRGQQSLSDVEEIPEASAEIRGSNIPSTDGGDIEANSDDNKRQISCEADSEQRGGIFKGPGREGNTKKSKKRKSSSNCDGGGTGVTDTDPTARPAFEESLVASRPQHTAGQYMNAISNESSTFTKVGRKQEGAGDAGGKAKKQKKIALKRQSAERSGHDKGVASSASPSNEVSTVHPVTVVRSEKKPTVGMPKRAEDKHWKINNSSRLPPGWKVQLMQRAGAPYACRWYTYKKEGREEQIFKNLIDVENFVNSDQPGAARHRKALLRKAKKIQKNAIAARSATVAASVKSSTKAAGTTSVKTPSKDEAKIKKRKDKSKDSSPMLEGQVKKRKKTKADSSLSPGAEKQSQDQNEIGSALTSQQRMRKKSTKTGDPNKPRGKGSRGPYNKRPKIDSDGNLLIKDKLKGWIIVGKVGADRAAQEEGRRQKDMAGEDNDSGEDSAQGDEAGRGKRQAVAQQIVEQRLPQPPTPEPHEAKKSNVKPSGASGQSVAREVLRGHEGTGLRIAKTSAGERSSRGDVDAKLSSLLKSNNMRKDDSSSLSSPQGVAAPDETGEPGTQGDMPDSRERGVLAASDRETKQGEETGAEGGGNGKEGSSLLPQAGGNGKYGGGETDKIDDSPSKHFAPRTKKSKNKASKMKKKEERRKQKAKTDRDGATLIKARAEAIVGKAQTCNVDGDAAYISGGDGAAVTAKPDNESHKHSLSKPGEDEEKAQVLNAGSTAGSSLERRARDGSSPHMRKEEARPGRGSSLSADDGLGELPPEEEHKKRASSSGQRVAKTNKRAKRGSGDDMVRREEAVVPEEGKAAEESPLTTRVSKKRRESAVVAAARLSGKNCKTDDPNTEVQDHQAGEGDEDGDVEGNTAKEAEEIRPRLKRQCNQEKEKKSRQAKAGGRSPVSGGRLGRGSGDVQDDETNDEADPEPLLSHSKRRRKAASFSGGSRASSRESAGTEGGSVSSRRRSVGASTSGGGKRAVGERSKDGGRDSAPSLRQSSRAASAAASAALTEVFS